MPPKGRATTRAQKLEVERGAALQRSTRPQADAQAQRHRSLGNDAEIRRVEALSAEVMMRLYLGM